MQTLAVAELVPFRVLFSDTNQSELEEKNAKMLKTVKFPDVYMFKNRTSAMLRTRKTSSL